MKNILITGGSGFLGRQIDLEARKAGYTTFIPRSHELNLETGNNIDFYFDKNKREFY